MRRTDSELATQRSGALAQGEASSDIAHLSRCQLRPSSLSWDRSEGNPAVGVAVAGDAEPCDVKRAGVVAVMPLNVSRVSACRASVRTNQPPLPDGVPNMPLRAGLSSVPAAVLFPIPSPSLPRGRSRVALPHSRADRLGVLDSIVGRADRATRLALSVQPVPTGTVPMKRRHGFHFQAGRTRLFHTRILTGLVSKWDTIGSPLPA